MRRQTAFWLVFLGAGVAAWVAAHALPPAARAFTVFLLVVLPPLTWWQARAAEEAPEAVSRGALYLSSAVGLWALALAAVFVSRASHFPDSLLGIRAAPLGTTLAWAAGVTAAGLAVLVAARLLHVRETRTVAYLMPVTAREKAGFLGLSITAGITEELVFRGFLLSALERATGSLLPALLATSLVFGLLHAYQSSTGALRATLLGALLAAPVVATGSIYPAMAAHAAIDLLAGLVLARWLLER